MGAWDYGALDNDPALEVLQRWQEWIDDPAGFGYEQGIAQYFEYWGDAINYGDSITNMEIIALVGIHLNKNLPVPKRLVEAATDAVNRELVPEELRSWAEPEKRKEALLRMLENIGGKRKPPKPPKQFRDPAIHFKNTAEAKEELLRLARIAYPKGYNGIYEVLRDEDAPPFLHSINRLMNHRIWEKDWKIVEQASLERRMMLAWYMGLMSGAAPDEIAQMLDRCRFEYKATKPS